MAQDRRMTAMPETRIQQFARRWGIRGWRIALEGYGAQGEISGIIMDELQAALEEVAADLPPRARMTVCQDNMDRETAQEQEQ